MNDFLEIVGLSIGVSLAATAVATAISLPAGTALAIFPFRGRRVLVVLINAFFGLPPVVVGLVLYLALSRSGPLGSLALLFTPAAMVIAQTILAIPIVTALVHRASERAWARYGDELISDGATKLQAIPQVLMIIRADLVTAVLAGFGRTVSEVGAVILVGDSNIPRLDPNDDDSHCTPDKPGRPVAGFGAWRGIGGDQHFNQRDGLRIGGPGANGGK